MKSIIRIFIFVLCTLALLVASSIALSVIYRSDIVKAALAAVAQNNELRFTSKDVDVTLSLNLRNTVLLFGDVDVSSSSSNDPAGTKFELRAESLRVEVDLLSFALRKEIKIKKLLVSNGQLKLRLAKSQSSPPRAAPAMPDTEDLLREVSRIQLERCRLSVEDTPSGSIAVEIQTLSADVEKKENGKLNLHTKGLLALQVSSRQKPAKHTRTNLSIDARGSLAQGVATIAGSKLGIDGTMLEARGSVAFRPLGELNMSITGKNLSIENLIRQAQKYATFDAPEQLSGRASVDVRLTGSLKGKAAFALAGSGTIRSAAVKLKDMEAVAVKELRYSVACRDAKDPKSYACTVSGDNVYHRSFSIGGSATVSNFKAPQYDVNATFSGDVASLKIASLPEGQVQGQAQIRAKGLSSEGIEELSVQASVTGLKALLQKEVYTLNGLLSADKSTLLPRLSISSGAAECAFDGAVQGYLPALLGEKEAAALRIRGQLNAKLLNLDKLFLQNDSTVLSPNVYAHLNVQAGEVALFDHTYRNVSGVVGYNVRSLMVNSLKAEAFDGTLSGDVKLYMLAGRSERLSCDLAFNGVQLESLPYLHKNFGVKPGSMQGKCDGAIAFAASVNKQGLDADNLSATINFTINNGRLLEFEPIQPLSAYLKKSLLQDVRFSALKNTLSLEKGKITIPKMEVRSTALNVLIAGTQELKGDFDYHITLYVSELLSRKEKNIENPIKEDKTKLFLHFTNKNGVTEVAHDRQEWSKNMEKKMQREAQEMKGLLRAEQAAGKPLPAAAQKKEKVAVEWDEDYGDLGATQKTEQHPKPKPQTKPQPKPQPAKADPKKQRSAVEVDWEE
ncbi:MAG: AsmA-like C-terminal region-containing protein [Prevotellaceae bacterium]|jgi:hypothetical protein|nr:AsmA-like C-terminal region-containing protein [Prevotellaceae bacterium]